VFQLDRISVVKATILKQEEKMTKMIASIGTSN
jgi:hypothetical protein